MYYVVIVQYETDPPGQVAYSTRDVDSDAEATEQYIGAASVFAKCKTDRVAQIIRESFNRNQALWPLFPDLKWHP